MQTPDFSTKLRSESDAERGAVVLEAALAVTGLLLFLIVAIDLVRVSYLSLAGQYAVDEAVRWGAIGSSLPGMTREDSIKETLKRISAGYSMPVDLAGVRICRLSLSDPLCSVESAGNPGEPFYVRMSYETRLVFGGISFSLSFLSAGTNEDYGTPP